MRKLAWFVIIFLIVALAIAVGCAYSPEFSTAVYSFGVDTVGAGIVTNVTGALTGVMAWGATGLAPSVAVLAGTLIIGSIAWLVILKRYIWPKIKGVAKPITPTITLRGGPEPELPQTIEQAKPETVKEET